jgi:hypothetical protein
MYSWSLILCRSEVIAEDLWKSRYLFLHLSQRHEEGEERRGEEGRGLGGGALCGRGEDPIDEGLASDVETLGALESSNRDVWLRWRDSDDMAAQADELAGDVGFESGEGGVGLEIGDPRTDRIEIVQLGGDRTLHCFDRAESQALHRRERRGERGAGRSGEKEVRRADQTPQDFIRLCS